MTIHGAGKDIWQEPEAPGDEHPEDGGHEGRRWKERLEGWTWKVPVLGKTFLMKPTEQNVPLTGMVMRGAHLDATLTTPITQASRIPLSNHDSEFMSTMAPTLPNVAVQSRSCRKTWGAEEEGVC